MSARHTSVHGLVEHAQEVDLAGSVAGLQRSRDRLVGCPMMAAWHQDTYG